MVLPLTLLLRNDQFIWHSEAQRTFEALKQCMIGTPILATPDFSLPFTLEFDALSVAMGAILLQNSHPIAFFSKPFCPRLQCSSTYVCKLHTITTTVRKRRHYLMGHPFVILTDHQSLKDLMSQVIQTPEQILTLPNSWAMITQSNTSLAPPISLLMLSPGFPPISCILCRFPILNSWNNSKLFCWNTRHTRT